MDIAENLSQIQERIKQACARSGRSPRDVTLVGVAKNQPPEKIRAAADLGVRHFGENRVQEAKIKSQECPAGLDWHMIGHLQSNKCRDAVHLFEMIESIDSRHLAENVNRAAEREGKTMPILLQVNVAGEASKFGYTPEQIREDLLIINQLPAIEIHGLMTIAPYTTTPERVRPCFKRLRELKTDLEQQLGAPLPHLSMGMSGDFETAIEEGATLVRIGTLLFGSRSG